jgi:hypothetical protein
MQVETVVRVDIRGGVVVMVRGLRFIRVLIVTVCLCCCVVVGSAWGLPLGRHYEQVSPLFKGGYGARQILDVELDGNSLIYGSFGAFAGTSSDLASNFYEANRVSGHGWSSVSLNPSASESPFTLNDGFSSSGASLWDLLLGAGNTALASSIVTQHQLSVRTAEGSGFRSIGPVLTAADEKPFDFGVEGVSDDFCQVIGRAPALLELAPASLLEAQDALAEQFYDVNAGCDGSLPSVGLVAMDNAGGLLSPNCPVTLGNASGSGSEFNAVSVDGSDVFFRASVPNVSNCSSPVQLFVRVGGIRTLEVSKPIGEECTELPCGGAETRAGASFVGASEDGSRVFFMTSAKLDPTSDQDTANDLYMATIGCPGEAVGCEAGQREVTSLAQVSHDPNLGEAAEVQGVVEVAPDGSHVYFVARGVLSSEGPSVEGAQSLPVHGADNLYVYERDGQYPEGHTVFVGDICSGPGISGAQLDTRCPNDLEGSTARIPPRNDLPLIEPYPLAQTIGADGGMLVFSTYAKLLDSGREADTDDAQDVYRFDTSSGTLVRVSVGESGSDANGNREDTVEVGQETLYDADARVRAPTAGFTGDEERSIVTRAASEDGSRIVFSTADPLSVDASNGLPDVYEWHNGVVSLISTGSSVEADEFPVITPSGRDVFFVTSQGLVSQDTDGAPDIYDAREGEGFSELPTLAEECSGDACQGPLTNPAPLLVPGSISQIPGENLPAPKKIVKKVKKKAKKKKVKAKKANHVKRASKGGSVRSAGTHAPGRGGGR